MSQRANPRLVGAFVVGALALAVVAVLVFGSGRVFREKYTHVVFFEGSVKGLDVGAPVSFRGVRVGEVTGVWAVADPEQVVDDVIFVEVILDIYDDVVRSETPAKSHPDYLEDIEFLIDRGLRARLETQSMITGQRYVSLEFYPDHPDERRGLNSKYHELPAVPTSTQELKRTVDRVVARLEELPMEEVRVELEAALEGFRRLVDSPELMTTLASVNDGMIAFHSTVETLEKSITSMTTNLDDSAGEIQQTLVDARDALHAVKNLADEGKVAQYETLENLNDTLDAIRVLVEYLERHPEAILSGKKGGDQ